MKEARAAGTSSSAGAMASSEQPAEKAGSGFPRLLALPRSRPLGGAGRKAETGSSASQPGAWNPGRRQGSGSAATPVGWSNLSAVSVLEESENRASLAWKHKEHLFFFFFFKIITPYSPASVPDVLELQTAPP